MADKQAKERLESVARHLIKDEPKSERPKFELEDHPIDEIRKLRVVVIGAGISGITAGILLPAKVPGIDLIILEKNSGVGGTWFENRYPGVRCDVPAHAYQSTFSPNSQWTEEYAQGPEILAYWKKTAEKHNVLQYIKFNQKVEEARWNPVEAQWEVKVTDQTNQETVVQKFDIVLTAIGRFNAWKLPYYPGINEYEGHLRHSSNWEPNFDPRGKNIATIGNGASGIQVTPELQKVAKHLDHYARSRTWIAGTLGGKERKAEPMLFPKELLKELENPAKYLAFRRDVENPYWKRFAGILRGSDENLTAKEDFKKLMAARLRGREDILNALVPDFSPNCRRLTPGPGYLEALTKDNVSFIQTPIKRFTKTGIETVDGVHRPVDAIICSTGANIDYAPPFPIISGDVNLASAWKPDGKYGFPYTYIGVGTPGFPNLFFIHGPNASGHSGTLNHSAENQITYLARLLRKFSLEGIKTIVPRKEAADDFVEYSDAFFPKTVLTENCSSWSNGGRPGGRIHGHWPGSAAHVNLIRRNPRWEDYEYEVKNKSGNRFAYWGNGWTAKEQDPNSDMTPYLKDLDKLDLRDHHESWWDL